MPTISKNNPVPVQVQLGDKIRAAQLVGVNKSIDIAYVRLTGQNYTTRVTCDCIKSLAKEGAAYA